MAACSRGAIVDASDPALSAAGGRLLYHGRAFSGLLRSTIPAMEELHFTAYRDGIQHGMSRKESSDGRLLAEYPYLAGMKHGLHRTWDREGQLRTYAEFRYGNYFGEVWAWYADGAPYEYRRYTEQGRLLMVRRWRNTGQVYLNQTFSLDGTALGMPGSKLCNPTEAAASAAQGAREERRIAGP